MTMKATADLTKLDRLDHFIVDYNRYYFDENQVEHLVQSERVEFVYKAEYNEFDSTYTEAQEDTLYQTIATNLVIGEDESLAGFEVQLEKGGLTTALHYYTEHRTEFSRDARQQYISNALAYIAGFDGVQGVIDNEVLTDEGYIVRVGGDNPVPDAAEGVFSYVRLDYVEDGAIYKYSGFDNFYDYSVYVTCVDLDSANAIKGMEFDQALLNNDLESARFTNVHDTYVEFIFESRQGTFPEVYPVVYPAVLIGYPDLLKEFENSEI